MTSVPVGLRHHRAAWFAALGALLLAACGKPATPAEPSAPPPPPPPPPQEHVPPPVAEEASEPPVKILSGVGFETPEAVYFDKRRDVYLVSNINGKPLGKDDSGFISKITPDGDVTLKFIDGAAKEIKLNAPKGLTVSGDVLYVADIDVVRTFDALTGAPKEVIKIPGSTFVNSVATGKDGIIYVSDSGLDADFNSTGSDSIYVIKEGKAEKLLKNKKLGGPNGLLAAEGGVWVATFGSGEIYFVSDNGKKEAVQKMPAGKNDGIIVTEDGRFLVSSWEASAVFAGQPGGEFHKEISGVQSPAAIGYDCKRNRVLIPSFVDNKVILHTLGAPAKEAAPTEASAPTK